MGKLDFKDVGRMCPICFNDGCPSREDCMRYFAAQQAPDDLEMHLCVTPRAAKGERCRLFQKKETVRVAYGFERSLDVVLGKDLTAIRKTLRAYFGYNDSYYKHLRGEWPLMPEQREAVEEIFRRFGYEGKVLYDRMDDVFMLKPVAY